MASLRTSPSKTGAVALLDSSPVCISTISLDEPAPFALEEGLDCKTLDAGPAMLCLPAVRKALSAASIKACVARDHECHLRQSPPSKRGDTPLLWALPPVSSGDVADSGKIPVGSATQCFPEALGDQVKELAKSAAQALEEDLKAEREALVKEIAELRAVNALLQQQGSIVCNAIAVQTTSTALSEPGRTSLGLTERIRDEVASSGGEAESESGCGLKDGADHALQDAQGLSEEAAAHSQDDRYRKFMAAKMESKECLAGDLAVLDSVREVTRQKSEGSRSRSNVSSRCRSKAGSEISSHELISENTRVEENSAPIDEFELRPAWTERSYDSKRIAGSVSGRRCMSMANNMFGAIHVEDLEVLDEDVEHDLMNSTTLLGRMMIRPDDPKRLCWDMVCIALTLYDTVVIPLQFFEMPEAVWKTYFGFVSMVVWTLDIPMSFLSGFYRRGLLEMRPNVVALHYVVTWFVFDVTLVLIEWLVALMTDGDGDSMRGTRFSKVGKSVRFIRVLRAARLLRLVKVQRIIMEIQDNIQSEYVNITIHLIKLICVVILISHFIACFWYGIGVNGWAQLHVAGASLEYKYMTAAHWSLTHFTPAAMEVMPTNTKERGFACLVLLFAMIIFSSLVGSITQAMTAMRELSNKLGMTSDFTIMRWYCRDHDIPFSLCNRINKYLSHTVKARRYRVHASDVKLLPWLSQSLQLELKNAIFGPMLRYCVFFEGLANLNARCMDQMCTEAVSQVSLGMDDLVFNEGELAASMYYPDGIFMYTVATEINGKVLRKAVCVCEAALWINHWLHMGSLRAMSHSEMIKVDVANFSDICLLHRDVMVAAQKYAASFLNALPRDDANLSDLVGLGHDQEQISHIFGVGILQRTRVSIRA